MNLYLFLLLALLRFSREGFFLPSILPHLQQSSLDSSAQPQASLLLGSLNSLIRHAAGNPACRAEHPSQPNHLLHVILSY
nr:MAG TPA: hypothetical protein [Caudoviricetes sp.]